MSRPEKEDATDDINHASDGEFLVEEVPRGKVATLVHWSVAVALRWDNFLCIVVSQQLTRTRATAG